MAVDREKHGYTVTANGEASLVFTLAYMDLPAQATGYDAEPLLQNDLDLKVSTESLLHKAKMFDQSSTSASSKAIHSESNGSQYVHIILVGLSCR